MGIITKYYEIINEEEEYDRLWNIIDTTFLFSPDPYKKESVYNISYPFDMYDISEIFEGICGKSFWEEAMREIFISVLGNDEFIYVLDWQHTAFKYNPNIKVLKNPIHIVDGEIDYNVYFPKFYPDGDYYIFIAKDFSWGYLTDPWRENVFVYGEELRKLFREKKELLKFKLIKST
jgi:hypothetical protein